MASHATMFRPASVMTLFAATAVLALCISLPLASATPLESKRAQAARITDEVEKLDHEYDMLQERFRGAQIRYNDLNTRVGDLNDDLDRTRKDLAVAHSRLVNRVVSVYQGGAANSRLVNLAMAGSVTKFIDRMETIDRVSSQDAQILEEIRRLRVKMARKRAQLKEARAEQQQVVIERRKARNAMGTRLAKRRTVLNSVNAEVQQLVSQEQERRRAAEAAAARASQAAAERQTRAAATGAAAPASSSDPAAALTPSVAPPPSSGASSAVGAAASQIGVKYTWGGSSPSTGFDCSGLVMWSYAQVGISLPHSTYALYGMGTRIARSQLAPGDLVFFSGLGHMGIYTGGGSFIHAPRTGTFVRYDSLSGYYDRNYVGAVRI